MIEQPTFAPATDRLRRAYGFDEVALVPGAVTVDPAEVDLAVELGGRRLEIPFLASAMDAVADVDFAVRMSRASLPRRPTNCTPIGSPFSPWSKGKVMAGTPQ